MTDAQIIALAQILFPLVVSFCVYLYQRFVPPSKQAQYAHAASIVHTVVMGVEQACVALNGPNKKAEAVRLIGGLLDEAGIKASPSLIDALIEQAVYSINQGRDPQNTQVVPVVRPN